MWLYGERCADFILDYVKDYYFDSKCGIIGWFEVESLLRVFVNSKDIFI